jgi:hypothetical protein
MARDPNDPSWIVDWRKLAELCFAIGFSYWLYGVVRGML